MLLYPIFYPKFETEKKKALNFSVNVPISSNCGYSDLPCSTEDISHVELRGVDLSSGFRASLKVETKWVGF